MRQDGRRRRGAALWPAWMAGLFVLAAFVAAAVLEPFPVGPARLAVFDFLQRSVPRQATLPADNPVVIVGIDERSLARLGQWPWPRARLADLAERLLDLGARVVAFDIVFAEPEGHGREAGSAGDAAFAAATRGRPVVLGMAAGPADGPNAALPYPGATVAADGAAGLRRLPPIDGLLRNLPGLETSAAGLGIILLSRDGDGVIRRVPTARRTPVGVIPSFFVEAWRVGSGAEHSYLSAGPAGIEAFRLDGGPVLATDAEGSVWPRFSRFEGRGVVSAADVLDGAVTRERIADRYVLVGATAMGLGDNHVSPLGEVVPGVEIHAQALEGALGGHLLARPAYMPGGELLALVVFGLFAIGAFSGCRAGLLLPALAGGVAAPAALSWSLFAGWHLLFDASVSIAAVIILFVVIVAVRQTGIGRR